MKTAIDETRFVAIYRENCRRVSAFVARRAEFNDVEDLVADTFEIAWRKRSEVSEGEELVWLFAIANFVLANHHRKNSRRSRLNKLIQVEQVTPSAESIALKDIEVAQAYRELNKAEQQLIALVYFDDLSISQAAKILKISANAASIRLSRIKAKLAAKIALER